MKLDYIKPELQAYATIGAQVLSASGDAEFNGVGIEGFTDGGTIDFD